MLRDEMFTFSVEVHFLTVLQVLLILIGDGVILAVLPSSSTYRHKNTA